MSTATDLNAIPSALTIEGALRIVFDRRTSIVDQVADIPDEIELGQLWLDFSEIEIVNSVELASLIRFLLRVRQRDASVLVSHIGPELQQLFELTRFDRYYQTLDPNSDMV